MSNTDTERNMDKVVCTECEYYKSNSSSISLKHCCPCKVTSWNYISNTPVKESYYAFERNQDGNCKHFKAKEQQ